jgi:hypothetical protein
LRSIAFTGKKIELPGISGGSFRGRGQDKVKAKAMSETLAGFRGVPFKMVVNEAPDIPDLGQVSFDSERPTFESRLTFPEKLSKVRDALAVMVVFRGIVAQEPKVEEVGRLRQKFKRREISFI